MSSQGFTICISCRSFKEKEKKEFENEISAEISAGANAVIELAGVVFQARDMAHTYVHGSSKKS